MEKKTFAKKVKHISSGPGVLTLKTNDEESNRKANIASTTRELEGKHAAVPHRIIKSCLDKQTENEQVAAKEGKQPATILQNLLRRVKTSGE